MNFFQAVTEIIINFTMHFSLPFATCSDNRRRMYSKAVFSFRGQRNVYSDFISNLVSDIVSGIFSGNLEIMCMQLTIYYLFWGF